jgi:Protein of unknown function (DUF2911).
MKKLITLLALLIATTQLFAQEQLSPRVKAKGDGVEISYGQPSKRGRVIFGDLVPYNELWRAGANEATEVTFTKDVNFGGKPVNEGTYTLFVIPKEKEWTVILNSQSGQWGSYDYEKYKVKNVAEITVPVYTVNDEEEKLTYSISKGNIKIEWDHTGVSIPLR